MIVILGLVILVAALIAGVAGVLANGGHAHAVTHFAVFGYHVTGSTGTLFLYGIVVGALAVVGLGLLRGARRTSRRGRDARGGLAQSAARPPPSARTATTCAASATPPAPTPPARWAMTKPPRTASPRTPSPRAPSPRTAPPRTAPIRACAGPACSRACSHADPLPRRPTRSQMRGRPGSAAQPEPRPPGRRGPAARPRPRSDSPVTVSSRHVRRAASIRAAGGWQVSKEIAR